ncbi:apolipophorin [Elysia marginata]|uniref:Apolipophorin n=1 Tax=Elysia marginata TaxID=1093978 RepID=A0AAV4EWF0_9GAST|nr:apolipophorin [Elysia marginata]
MIVKKMTEKERFCYCAPDNEDEESATFCLGSDDDENDDDDDDNDDDDDDDEDCSFVVMMVVVIVAKMAGLLEIMTVLVKPNMMVVLKGGTMVDKNYAPLDWGYQSDAQRSRDQCSDHCTAPLDWGYQSDSQRSREQCSDHCTASNKFQYEADKTYEYNYEVLTTTSMHGASDDVAKIIVSCTVNIHVISKCEMVLTLSNVDIKRSSPETSRMTDVADWTFKRALQGNALRFSFQDGLIDDLCPSDEEEPRSLNFKRAVLSAFQNSMTQHVHEESMREIDVVGECPTQYSIHQKGWKATQFSKVKDLLGCSDRYQFTTALQATPFRAPDAIQSLPLLKGDHKCTQTVSKEGLVKTIQCMESLVFRPFSKKEAGARTHTSQTMNLVNTKRTARVHTDDVNRRTSLLFEHDLDSTNNDQTLFETREKLAELCRITVDEIPAVVPSLFTDVVYLMRRLTGSEFMSIAEGVHRGNICSNNKDRAKKFFYDALPMVGTSASVQVMVELLLSKEVQGMQAQLWLKSLHFLPEPTEEMVVHAKRLVLSDDHRMTSLLPVTTLVSHYCKSDPDCSSNDNVKLVTEAIRDVLANECQSDDQDLVLLALRSVGNLGFADNIVRSLEKCAKNDKLPMHLRVSALQAYRGVKCGITRRTPMEIFLDKGEDSELRIAAYLAVMDCPFENVLSKVKQQLEREEVNQVGSFVWTHLTNMQKTSILHKQAVRSILEDEELKKAFDLDKRKFSRNYELSYFSKDFGLGGSAESNLVWSEKSFVPRSATLNITVDILGHTVNLLEVGGRVQGVEGLLQEVIGSSEFFKGGVTAPRRGRNANCAKQQKLDKMKEKFGVDKDEMSATVYLRLFGNEFGHRHFSESELTGVQKDMQPDDLMKTLAKGRELSWTQSALFLDSTMQVPTVAGMPLALSVNGTTTMDLRAEGKLDMQKISLKKMVAKLDFRPSAAVQFSGRMSVGLGSTHVGLKMITTLHTSTAVSSSIDLNNGQVLVVKMDTPKRSMDVLNVKSEFYIQHDKEDHAMDMNKEKPISDSSCSSESTLRALGYQACAEYSYVPTTDNSPYYPFTGPTSVSLTVHKKDAPRGYKFIGKHIMDDKSAVGLLSVDTPGSKADRALNVGFSFDRQDQSAEIELNSPWKKVLAKGSYISQNKLQKFHGTVRYDGREHSLMMNCQEEKIKGKTVWTSLIELEKPQDSILIPGGTTKFSINTSLAISKSEISAQAIIDTGLIKIGVKPNIVDLKFDYVNSKTEKSVSGSATIDLDKKYSGTLQMLQTINKKWTTAKLQPTVLISAPKWRIFLLSGQVDYKSNKLFKTDMSITMDKTLKKPLKLETRITKMARKSDDRYRGSAKLFTQFANFKLSGFSTNKNNKKVSSRLKVDYTIPLIKNKRERKNKLMFNSKFHDRSTKTITRYDLSLNCENKLHPDSGFTSKADLTHKNGLTKAGATINYGPKRKNPRNKINQIRTEVSVNHKLKKNDAEIIYSALFIYPLKAMEYEIKGKHEHHLKDKPRFETYVTTIYGKGKAAELRVRGTNLSKRGKLDMQGGLELSLPPFTVDGKKKPTSRYTVSTTLQQEKGKEYIHTVNLQLPNDSKHSVVSRLTAPTKRKPTEFDFSSKLDLDLKKPTSLTLKIANGGKDAVVSGVYLAGIKSYSAELASSYQDAKYQKVTWDIVWPERHVKGSAEGGQKGEREGGLKIVSYWDADRDQSKKIETEIYHKHQEDPEYHDESLFTLTTPFDGHRKYVMESLSVMKRKRVETKHTVVWRNPENEFSFGGFMLLPPSAERFEMQAEIKTPFDQLRQSSVSVAHKWDGSKHLSTTVEGGYNGDDIKTVLLFSNSGNAIRKTVSGSLAVTSTVPEVSDVLLTLEHEDDGVTYGSVGVYRYKGSSYRATMNATHIRVDHQMTTNAKLQVELPSDRPIVVTWAYTNTLMHLNSTLELQWRPEYNSKIILGAKGSQAEKDYALDLKIITPGQNKPDEFDLQLRQNMMTDYHGSAHWAFNFMPELETTVSYSFSDKAFEVVYAGEGQVSRIETHYEKLPYTGTVRTTWRPEPTGPEHTILFEASVNTKDFFSADAKLTTPWEGAQNVDMQVSLKNKTVTKWEFDSLVSLGVRRHISANFNVDTDGSSLRGNIKTPFEQMRKMEFDWKYKQVKGKYTNEAHIEIVPLFNKVTLEHSTALSGSNVDSRVYLEIPDTDIKSVEIKLDNTQLRRGYNTNLNVKYQRDQEIDLQVKSRFHAKRFPDKTKFHVDLSTPFAEFPSLGFKTELEKKSGKWVGFMDLKTEVDPLEELFFTFEHAQETTSSVTDVELTSSAFETVTAGAHFDWGDRAKANVTFMAPSVGRTSVGFIKKSDSWTNFQNKIFAEFDDKQLDLEVGLKHEEDETRGWLVYSLPLSEHSSVKANVHRLGSDFTDINVGAFLQLGRDNKPYNVSAQYAYKPEKKYALGTTLETPMTRHLSYLYQLEISRPYNHSMIIYTKYGQEFLFDWKTQQTMSAFQLDQSSHGIYRLADKSSRFGATLSAQWSDGTTTANYVSYTDNDKLTVDFSHQFGDVGKKYRDEIEVDMTTPYKGFSDVGFHATVNSHKDGSKHGGKLNVNYMDGKEAELTFDLDTPNKHRAGLTAVLSIPVKGYKKNRLTYNHVILKDRFKADAKVVTGKGQSISSDLDFKDQALTFTVNGPVEKFEALAVTAKFDSQKKTITGDAWYQLSNIPNPVSLKYDLALRSKPVVLDFELTNVAGKVTNLRIEHDGSQLRNFHNVIDLKSEAPQLNNVHIETFWQLKSANEVELRCEMTSNHPQYDRAEMKFNTGTRWDEQFSELKLEWSPDKKIYITNGFTFDKEKERPSAIVTFTINTPWEELEDVALEFSHKPTKDSLNENVVLRYNRTDLLDASFIYSSPNDRHRAVLTFRKPQPMVFSAEGKVEEGLFDGNLKLDWDQDSPVGRVEIVSSYTDKSTGEDLDKEFKFKVNHPVRTLGVDFLYKAGENEFRSAGLYTWDEARGNTFSYDLGWANRTTRYSRMLEGHVKAGIPQRSVKYMGSYSDTGRTATTTNSFNWHADEDETKKVTMTTSVEQNDNFKRVDLNINIPYINKQLNLGAITKGGYGRNLLDTKAEISYSSDPSKTIVINSLVSNSIPESSGDSYNYTLEIGFQHPVSGIDLALVSHVADVNNVLSAGSDLSFVNVLGRRQNLNFFTKMDHRNKRFEIMIGSPVKSLGLQGQANTAHHGRTLVSAVAFEDGQEALKLGMVIDPRRRHLDLEFNYDQENPDKLLSVSGGFVNDSALTLDVTTQASRDSPAQTETLIAVRLNSSQLMHTRILWRPNVDAEIREFLGTKLTEFSYKTNDFLKKAVEIMGQEVSGKYMLVSEELRAELTPVFDLMEQEMDSLNIQLNTLWVKVRRFHQQNHMHIKDMGDQIAKVFQEINEQLVSMVRNYRVYYMEVNEATQEWLEHLNTYPIGHAYQEFVNHVAVMLKEVEGAMEDLLSVVVTEVGRLADEYYREYMKLSRKIDRKLDSYARSVQELPLYRKMVEQRAQYGEKVPEWVHWYDTVYVKSQEVLQNQFHDFMAREEFQHMFAVVNEVLGQVKHYNQESSLGTIMQRVTKMTKNILLMELAKLKKTIMDFRKTKVIVYDPERGELQLEMYLPIPLKSLYEAPELNPERYVAHAQRLVQDQVDKITKMLPDSNSSLWDLYYDHMPSTDPSSWVPPYDASAYLIGSQHIITFDKHEYDFLSKCSHVLTRDNLMDRFSVVVNYNRRPRREGIRSLCFTIEDNHIQVSTNYKLKVNHQAVEMPFISDKIKVVREGDIIRVQYIHGLEVLCNPQLDLYRFTVSGWYHGRLAGLLGHYDNEKHNDLALSETSADYEVNKRNCKSTNMALKPQPEADKDGVCLKLFSSSNAKLRPCFNQVDPSGFRELCETYMGKMSVEEAARLASEQYRFVCQGQGVFISALEEFASCGQDSKGFVVKGNDAKFQSADVVFVVEDAKCNKWARNSLPSIVTQMNQVLMRKGFTENRFGLEGFGGIEHGDVSVRTIDGQHFGGARLFLKALETLRFPDSAGDADLALAVREAAQYPFRAGVAKVLVIAPCSKCEVGLLDSTLVSNLADYGFQVHILQEKEYNTEGFTVLGTNSERFFPSGASDFNGVLRKDRVIEQRGGQRADFCQDVAHQTGGAVFDTTTLAGRTGTQRQFVNAFSSHVAMTTKLPECQECRCDPNTGRTQCSLCGASNNYMSNAVESAKESLPDNYLMLGM